MDHFSQARLFFNSQSESEKNHLIDALRFELGKVETKAIRERMLFLLSQVDNGLANEVAYGLGLAVPNKVDGFVNQSIPADANPKSYQPVKKESSLQKSEALSMANTIKNSIQTRKIAVLAADGVDNASLKKVQSALTAEGAVVEIIAPKLGTIESEDGEQIEVRRSLLTVASVLYDAVYVPGGTNSVATLKAEANAIHFLNEAYKHCKAIAVDENAQNILEATYFANRLSQEDLKGASPNEGLIVHSQPRQLSSLFIKAIASHRFWEREKPRKVPA
jgi:catalase